MALIEGLTEKQYEQLKGMRVGDMLLITRVPKVPAASAHDHDESDDEDAETSGDGEMQDGSEENGALDSINEDINDTDVVGEGASEPSDIDSDSEAGDIIVDRSLTVDDASSIELVPKAVAWLVQAVSEDEPGNITDITLCEMAYCRCAINAHETSYSIIGDRLLYGDGLDPVNESGRPAPFGSSSITELVKNDSYTYLLKTRCSAHDIIVALHHGHCPGDCDEGFLSNQSEMEDILGEANRTLPDYKPICPACMGKDLAMEQYSLRNQLHWLNDGTMDLGMVVEFMGRLNTARLALGYPFKQFDEREWGYMFDDMLSEDGEDERSVDGDGGCGYYGEAMDPAGGVVAKPASDEAVAALPRKTFAELKDSTTQGNEECLICRQSFEDGAVVAVMPCGHFFCEEGCLLSWLKQSNSCPACRTKLPAKENEATFADGHHVISTAPFDDFGHFMVRDGFNDDRTPSELSNDDVVDTATTGDAGNSGTW